MLAIAPEPATTPEPRARGKIAELPKDQRDLVNHLLDDGATYKVVAAELGKLGVSLNGENISNWFSTGYQEHVRFLEWRAEIRSLRESAAHLPELNDGHQFQQNLIQLGLTDIFRALKQRQFEPDSPNYIRLFNALARLNREALALRKYDDLVAKEHALQPKPIDPNRDPEKDRDLMLNAMEQAMGFKAAPGPIGLSHGGGGGSPPCSADVQCGADVPPAAQITEAHVAEVPPPDIASIPIENHPSAEVLPTKAEEPNSENSPGTQGGAGVSSASSVAQDTEARVAAVRPPVLIPIENHPSAEVLLTEAEESKIKNGQGLCRCCKILLPPLLKNGERPLPVCPKCGEGLFPPPRWSRVDYPPPNADPTCCDLCRQRHQLDPNGLPDPCSQCGYPLASIKSGSA